MPVPATDHNPDVTHPAALSREGWLKRLSWVSAGGILRTWYSSDLPSGDRNRGVTDGAGEEGGCRRSSELFVMCTPALVVHMP